MAVKDDEQDIPFRWSLFLPAAGDSPSLRMLKYAVIGMGVVLILGFFVIAARIVYLTSRMDASLPTGSEMSIAVPTGAEVTNMSLSGNRLALHLAGPGETDRSITVIDLTSGKVVSRVMLTHSAAPASTSNGTQAPLVPR